MIAKDWRYLPYRKRGKARRTDCRDPQSEYPDWPRLRW